MNGAWVDHSGFLHRQGQVIISRPFIQKYQGAGKPLCWAGLPRRQILVYLGVSPKKYQTGEAVKGGSGEFPVWVMSLFPTGVWVQNIPQRHPTQVVGKLDI